MKNLSLQAIEQRFDQGNITESAEWYDSLPNEQKTKIELIAKAIRENRLIDSREQEIESEGIPVENLPMGSGGVGQIKIMNDGKIRIQIGCGVGKYNYAKTAIL